MYDTLASNVLLLRRQIHTLDELAAFKAVDLGHIKDRPPSEILLPLFPPQTADNYRGRLKPTLRELQLFLTAC
jgi:hypothetical protein